jgi:hypothetical protein
MSQSLRDLNLVPSAALLIVPLSSAGIIMASCCMDVLTHRNFLCRSVIIGSGPKSGSASTSSTSAAATATSWFNWIIFPVQFFLNFVWSFIFPTAGALNPPPAESAGSVAGAAAASRSADQRPQPSGSEK